MSKDFLSKRKQLLVDLISADNYIPMTAEEIAYLLGLSKKERKDLNNALDELTEEGKILRSKRGKYHICNEVRYVGKFSANAKGFGFVTVEGIEEDFFIPRGMTGSAMHTDTVEIQLLRGKKDQHHSSTKERTEAQVINILERGITTLVGTFEESKNFGFVVPDNTRLFTDIYIPHDHCRGAKKGQKVCCKIVEYGDEGHNPVGDITMILGYANEPGVDIEAVVMSHDIPQEFPREVLDEAISVAVEIPEEKILKRRDLRTWDMVTIDGEESKDLDDAVSLQMEGENYILGVHIADVSEYVIEDSCLDQEAKKRGTSVYLLDRVIPMLPQILSNGMCSLNEGQDRLTLSCIMTISRSGEILDHEICESVINSSARMTYHKVADILEGDLALREEYAPLVPMFEQMEVLSKLLRQKRHERGAVDFDFAETVIQLDQMGRPIDIYPYERTIAHLMIEDFMLAANETVAEDFYHRGVPFLYRSHAKPEEERITNLRSVIGAFGLTLQGNSADMKPKELQQLIERVKGTPEENLVTILTLRSMMHASYTVEAVGHYGLAAKYYSHFTSPIRRYPDLQIHRIIKENLRGQFTEERRSHYAQILDGVAESTSSLERRAEEAERECDKIKKVQFMENHVGETFEGSVSGVTEWGLYVALPNTVEGLVHVRSMEDDHYVFAPETYELIGQKKNKHYKLGQPLKVRLDATDTKAGTIDFSISEG